MHKLRSEFRGLIAPMEEPRLTQLIEGDDDAIINARDAIDIVFHTSCDEFIITGDEGSQPMLNLRSSSHDLRAQLARAHHVSDAALSSSLSSDVPRAPRLDADLPSTSSASQDHSAVPSAPSGPALERTEGQPGVLSMLVPRRKKKTKQVQIQFHQSDPSSSTPADLKQVPGRNTRAQVTRRLTRKQR